jgi:predicted permease
MRDFFYALRTLRKAPGFTCAALVLLALGSGANTAVFSVVNAVLLRPLPFEGADRLMKVDHTPPAKSFPGVKLFSVSAANYVDWKARSHSFERMAAYGARRMNLTGGGRPEAVLVTVAAADFFPLLRAHAELGRVFNNDEDAPGHGGVAVTSHSFWQSHFGSSTDAIGRTLILDGKPYRIIGVMPSNFHLKAWGPLSADLWVPLAWSVEQRAVRGNHNYQVVARLRDGVTVQQSQAEMDSISAQLAQQYPDEDAGWGAEVATLNERIVGKVRPALLVLLGAVAFVMMIVCANVANLALARSLGRSREMAIRAALGAGRARAVRQSMMEMLILSAGGGILGLALASWGVRAMAAMLTDQIPRGSDIGLDGWVLTFALFTALAAGMITGAIPAWRALRIDLNDSLKRGLGRAGASRGHMHNALVTVEVALSLALLIGAGLMVRSLWNLEQVDPGFDPHHVLSVTLALPQTRYAEKTQQVSFYETALDRIRALPGVRAAAGVDNAPLEGGSNVPIVIEGRPAEAFAQQPVVPERTITPSYFDAFRIPLLRGRDINEGDRAGTVPVAVISKSLAERYWRYRDPIGKHIIDSFEPKISWTIVGVVGDIKDRGVDAPDVATLYLPFTQLPTGFMNLEVRSAGDPDSLTSAVSAVLHDLDGELPIRNVTTMDEVLNETLAERRFSVTLLASFAMLALALAAAGIYSVLAYAVGRRTREIGIRMAIGATFSGVMHLVVKEGLKPALLGVLAGLALAFALTRFLANMIFGVTESDPATYACVAALLIAVSMAASAIPAWRAARVDPVRALREE